MQYPPLDCIPDIDAMASTPTRSSLDEVTALLSTLMSGENESTNTSQLRHRLNILQAWLGSFQSLPAILSSSTILEFGCGQGDMTVPLAHFAANVIAVDPAPLDYGSPFTLGQAQEQVSQSALVGSKIHWVQREPIQYMQDPQDIYPDLVVLAHSIFYFDSEQYFADLLRAIKAFVSQRRDGKTTKLLIAEWGMRASNPTAQAHLLAAKAQATNPQSDGNVRTVILPERVRELAEQAGYKMEKESWIESPNVEDGEWEVMLARIMANEERTIQKGPEFLEMERAVGELGDRKVSSMDVWTSVFQV